MSTHHTQTEDDEMKALFASLAEELTVNENKIVEELNEVQGQAMDIDGYYFADQSKASLAMRPSETFNAALDSMSVSSK